MRYSDKSGAACAGKKLRKHLSKSISLEESTQLPADREMRWCSCGPAGKTDKNDLISARLLRRRSSRSFMERVFSF